MGDPKGRTPKIISRIFIKTVEYIQLFCLSKQKTMIETTVNKSSTVTVPTSKTITIRPASLQQNSMNKNQQQIIVIPQSMLVNGCISAKDLKSIIGEKKSSNSNQTQLSPSSPQQNQNCVKT